jgi:S1-C subfamily serine protease
MRTLRNGVAVAIVALVFAISEGEAKADGIPLGIVIVDAPTGVVVTDVTAGGIADRCMPRLRPGAHIIDLNGAPVTSAEQFRKVLLSSHFVRFHFVDPTGELRWANAWSGGRPPLNCRP